MAEEAQAPPEGRTVRPAELLGLFPPFLASDLLEDADFRDALDLELGLNLAIDETMQFDRGRFLEAVRQLHRGIKAVDVADEAGVSWTFTLRECEGQPRMLLHSAEREIELPDFALLHPDAPEVRLAALHNDLDRAGLPRTAATDWKAILARRPLSDDELVALERELEETPVSVTQRLSKLLHSRGFDASDVVPSAPLYYARLCGDGAPVDVGEMITKALPDHIGALLAWDPRRGAELALLLAVHVEIVPSSPLVDLPDDLVGALLEWASADGDLIAKIGGIDLGLAKFAASPALEPLIIRLFEQVRDLDIADEDGPLHLLMAALMLTGGELARTRALAKWPTFKRRLAVFAHAALVQRILHQQGGARGFARWATDHRGRSFYFQALVDMREEPRWQPEFIAVRQLKDELLGRVRAAAQRHEVSIPEGSLRDLLFGQGADGLRQHLNFPMSFWPGPLEAGLQSTAVPLPEEYEAILDDTLAADILTPRSVTALINLRSLFTLSDTRIERAVAVMRNAGHRFATAVDTNTRETLFIGLAGVAGVTRSAELADALRMMMRKDRIDGEAPVSPIREFMIAMMAAAAHAEFDAWADFIGNWAEELAFTIKDKTVAVALLGDLRLLTAIEPRLRRKCGRAISALASYAEMP